MSGKKENEGGFFKFLYNKDTGEVLGRTGTSWAKIIVFYIIFYAGLAAFFGLMLYIFYMTLDIQTPKYTAENSLIGTNPGVGFRPQPDQDANVDSTLIWFNKNNEKEYKFWSDQLKGYVNQAKQMSEDAKSCSFNGEKVDKEKACKVNTDELGPCTEANAFGYKFGEPCVLIKLNRIFDWRPKGFGNGKKPFDLNQYETAINTDVEGKQQMPAELKQSIKTWIAKFPGNEQAVADSVWISCSGENPADRENMGVVTYYPMPGIPSFYFPFMKQKSYQSPFIMVHFAKVTPGVLINIECKAWASNIHPDRQTRTGSVHFEMMVD